ncbi:MAG: alpha/beta hydrolase [Halobacteriovorax sp.]|nr:alpha/beta hydrolase [Halobacteriovorax sp.]
MRILFLLVLLASCASTTTSTLKPQFNKDLDGFDYPYEVRTFTLTDYSMAYMDIPSVGPSRGTVVLMHGKNFNGAYWGKSAADLSKIGFRVIIPDQLGFGKSDKPTDYQYSFHALADNTRRLLDSLKIEQVSLVGHSMGGMVATRFALMFPKRVTRLALVNPIGLEDWKRYVPYTPIDQRISGEKKQTRESIVAYQMKAYYDGKWSDEYEQTAAHLIGWAQGPDKDITAEVAALTYEMVFTQPVVYEFELLTMPTHLIIGERDRTALGRNLVPSKVAQNLGRYDRLGKQTCKKIKNCSLFSLKGIGHLPQVESYNEYITSLRDFLIRK